MLSVIYKIQSQKFPERIYIGSAVDYHKRIKRHIRELERNKHFNATLQNHVDKYGISDLEFSILIIVEKNMLVRQEQIFIDSLKPYFNICTVAGSRLNAKHSDATKNKIRAAKSGKRVIPIFQWYEKLTSKKT